MERYKSSKQIGVGGFGSVYKAIRQNGQKIAVKIVNLGNTTRRQEVEKEVKMLMAISDPCIPSLACYYNSYIDKNNLYIEMEFIDGITLLVFARKNRTKSKFLNSLTAILGDIVPAVKYLHTKGILHRDIKPENIMIEKTKNQPKLIDVGLACVPIDELECDKACCRGKIGTVYFMSPETLLDGISYTESDIWSLGATIYQAATNRFIFQDEYPISMGNLIKRMQEDPIILLNTKDQRLDKLLSLMLQKDYKKRISLDDILIEVKK